MTQHIPSYVREKLKPSTVAFLAIDWFYEHIDADQQEYLALCDEMLDLLLLLDDKESGITYLRNAREISEMRNTNSNEDFESLLQRFQAMPE